MPRFDAPDTGNGDLFTAKDNDGRLLLVTPLAYEPAYTSSFGTGPMVKADIVVLDGPDAPKTYDNAMVFGVVLTDQIRNNCGTGVPKLGRLGKVDTKSGRSAWSLGVFNQADEKIANDYLDSKDHDQAKQDAAPF